MCTEVVCLLQIVGRWVRSVACVDNRLIASALFCSFDVHKFWSECNWSASRPIHVNKFSIQAMAKFMNSVRSQSAQNPMCTIAAIGSKVMAARFFDSGNFPFFFHFPPVTRIVESVSGSLRSACQLYPDWNLIGGIFRFDDASNWQSIWMAYTATHVAHWSIDGWRGVGRSNNDRSNCHSHVHSKIDGKFIRKRWWIYWLFHRLRMEWIPPITFRNVLCIN